MREAIPEFKIDMKVIKYIKFKEKIKVSHPDAVYQFALKIFGKDEINWKEKMYVMKVDSGSFIVGFFKVTEGYESKCLADIKTIMMQVIKTYGTGFILVHNHPSGDVEPSDADIKLTKQLIGVCRSTGITFLDHIIISPEGYKSFLSEEIVKF
jgi:DNA repair protein RadC